MKRVVGDDRILKPRRRVADRTRGVPPEGTARWDM